MIAANVTRRHFSAVTKPDDERRRFDELAFLPAALEIVETPPSPLGRATAFSIIAVFGVGLAWACFGTVDIVAIAPGKLIPSGRTKTIQPFETGVVRSIKVHDGQGVKSGDVLIELDTTITAAELGHLKSDLLAAQLDVARLKAALTGRGDPLAAFIPPTDATPTQVEMHRRFLISQTVEQNAKLAAVDQQVKQKAERGEGCRTGAGSRQGRITHQSPKTDRADRWHGPAACGSHNRRRGDAGADAHAHRSNREPA